MDIVLKLRLDDKEVDAKLENADQVLKELQQSAKDTNGEMSKMGNIVTGFKNALDLAKQSMDALKSTVISGAELQTLRKNFHGTAEDIELLRKATSGVVSEASLIKLSNQAKDLGVSLKDQAILFDLADDAADKYGGTIEDKFQQIINSTEGSARGLRQLGIQKAEYEQIVERLTRATGRSINNLDAEEQKRIKLQAIVIASGKSLEDLEKKVVDNDDKMQALGIRIDEGKQKIGIFITDAITPLIDKLNQSGTAGDVLLGALSGIYGVVVPLIPVIVQLTTMKRLLGDTAFVSSGKVTLLNTALASGLAKLVPYLKAVGVLGLVTAAGVGTYHTIDQLVDPPDRSNRTGRPVEGKEVDDIKNMLAEFNKTPEMEKLDKIFSMLGTGEVYTPETKGGTTIRELHAQIEKLNTELLDVEAGSKRHLDIIKELETLSNKISPKKDTKKKKDLPLAPDIELYKPIYDEFWNEVLPGWDEFDVMADYPWDKIEQLRIDAMKDGLDKQQAQLELWYAQQLETSLYRENIEAKIAIDEQYLRTKAELKQLEFQMEVQVAMQTLEMLRTSFKEHTTIAKAASVAMALIQTYTAATAALAPPPIGAGPLFGPALAVLTVISGLANVQKILSTNVTGYERGGIVVGESGPEIIAPMQDYATGWALLAAKTVLAVENYLRASNSGINSSISLDVLGSKMDAAVSAFEKKQFRLRRGDLVTSFDNYNNKYSDLEI